MAANRAGGHSNGRNIVADAVQVSDADLRKTESTEAPPSLPTTWPVYESSKKAPRKSKTILENNLCRPKRFESKDKVVKYRITKTKLALKLELNLVRNESNVAKDNLTRTRKELRTNHQQLTDIQNRYSNLKTRHQSLEQESSELKAKLSELQNRHLEALKVHQNEAEKLRSKVETMKQSLDEKDTYNARKEDEYKTHVMAIKQDLDAKVKEADNHRQENERFKDLLFRMKRILERTQEENELKEREITNLEAQLQRVNISYKSEHEKVVDANKKNHDLALENRNLKELVDTQKISIEAVGTRKDELESKLQQTEELVKQLRDLVSDQQMVNHQLKQSVIEMKKNVEVAGRTRDEKEQQNVHLQAQCKELKDNLKEMTRRVRVGEEEKSELRSQCTALTEKLSSDTAEHKRRVENLETDLAKARMKSVYPYFKGDTGLYLAYCATAEAEFDKANYRMNRTRAELKVSASMRDGTRMKISEQLVQCRGQLAFPTDITVGNVIGTGAYGHVYFAYYKGSVVAYKVLKGVPRGKEISDTIQQDILRLCQVEHPNLVRYFSSIRVQGKIGIVMEYMEVTLHDVLHVYKSPFSEGNQLLTIQQICSGLRYLHSANIAHCNLKSTNILLNNTEGRVEVKIADFGCSMIHPTNSRVAETHTVSVCRFSAPEVLSGKELTIIEMMKADIYSLALLTYNIVYKVEPFHDYSDKQVADAAKETTVLTLEPFQNIKLNVQLKNIMCEGWRHSPVNRPPIQTFHTIFAGLEKIYVQ